MKKELLQKAHLLIQNKKNENDIISFLKNQIIFFQNFIFLRRETRRKNVYLSKHLWKISNKEILKKTQIADKSCKAIDYSKRLDGILIGI